MSEYEFTVSLRIRHPTIDPMAVTEALGIQPQHCWRAGQPRCDSAGAKLGGAHHDSYWMGRLMAEPQLSCSGVSVERVILAALSHMRRAQAFLERLSDEGGVAELLVSLYARDVFRLELPPDALTLLGRLHFAVALDVHPHSPLNSQPSRTN
jgi:hypothetical protein